MKMLCITIHFLDGQFHGQGDHGPEWPPSPFRLFQAMLAASSRNGNAADEGFLWLEQLAPPEILVPTAQNASVWKTYVPNNDSDKKPERQDRLAEKVFRPVHILGHDPVCYLWQINPDDQNIAEKLILQARRVSALGWGIDLVAVDGNILSPSAADNLIKTHSGQHWRSAEDSRNLLRCPSPGSLSDLRSAYESFLNRFNGNVYNPARKSRVFIETPYARAGTVQRNITAFKLLRPNDDSEAFESFDQRKTMEIAAWVRGYLCQASQTKGFPGDSGVFVAGHVPVCNKNGETPPRFSYLPVPSIGHEHADGRVRRFILAEPYGGDGSYVNWARYMLSNTVVTDKQGRSQARLQPMDKPDSVIYHFVREARSFHTVTPVILPGYDDMKYSKALKLVEKAIEQAGFSTNDLAEPIYLQKAPFRKGGYSSPSYSLPKYLKGNSAMHVRLKWKEPIPGPMAIGAGRHFGLGLFVPETGENK
jgi:CRISPR-associated protein Csb2